MNSKEMFDLINVLEDVFLPKEDADRARETLKELVTQMSKMQETKKTMDKFLLENTDKVLVIAEIRSVIYKIKYRLYVCISLIVLSTISGMVSVRSEDGLVANVTVGISAVCIIAVLYIIVNVCREVSSM